MKKRFFSLVLALTMALSLTAPALSMENGHGPVGGENSTYIPTSEEAKTYVTGKGWMTGTEKGFEPDLEVNRAMVYEMFWKMEGKPTPKAAAVLRNGQTWATDAASSAFQDVVGKWYDLSANWAYEVGLTTGTENGYEGERIITKQELLTILYRYMKDYKQLDVTVEEGWSLEVFEDYGKIQSWAADAMMWGWLSGVACQNDSDPAIDPEAPVKRVEMARMLTVMGRGMDAQAEAAAQPVQTAAPGPGPEPGPAQTPEPTLTPAPTSTPGPISTPAPIATPSPVQTPDPAPESTVDPATEKTGNDMFPPQMAGVRGSCDITLQDGAVADGSTVRIENYSRGAGVWVVLVCSTKPIYKGEVVTSDAQNLARSPGSVMADINISALSAAFPVAVYELKEASRPAKGGDHTFSFPEDFDLLRSTGELTADAVEKAAADYGVELTGDVVYDVLVNMSNSYGYLGSTTP